jgi:hypothetical protein
MLKRENHGVENCGLKAAPMVNVLAVSGLSPVLPELVALVSFCRLMKLSATLAGTPCATQSARTAAPFAPLRGALRMSQ